MVTSLPGDNMRIYITLVLMGAGLGVASAQTSSPNASWAMTIEEVPAVATALGRIESYLKAESPLGRRRVELLTLVTARELNLAYAWSVNEPMAQVAGLEPTLIDVIRHDEPVVGLESDDALLIDFGRELYRQRHVASETFAALVDRFGRQASFDAMMALSWPAMLGLLQRAVGRQPPATWDPDDLPAIAGIGTSGGRPGDFVELGARPPLPADVYEESYYRFPLFRRDELDPPTREIFDRVVGADQAVAPGGPVGMTFNSPAFVEPVQQINTALRSDGSLGTRLAEIVIAATGREMNSQYQWIVHGAGAARAGAGQSVLDALSDDGDLSGLDERDRVAIAFVRELFRDDAVSSQTFDAAVDLFGTRGTIEIAALAGDYLMMTTVYNALGMRLRPDQEPALPHRAGAPVGAEWR
jgi:4-carboxymuconolactone decarboxylase